MKNYLHNLGRHGITAVTVAAFYLLVEVAHIAHGTQNWVTNSVAAICLISIATVLYTNTEHFLGPKT
nr:MAG TPA: hypothetical protein [Caudoviricetes sp.]